VPFSNTSARSHASITGAYAAIARFPGSAREGSAGGASGPSASRYFLTVRQFSRVSRAISEIVASACRSALNRRSSSRRSASSTIASPREDHPSRHRLSVVTLRYQPTRRNLCTFTRTYLCT
jgi:hypothetical protein